MTPIFLALSTGPTEVTCDHVALKERLTILLFNHISSKVNWASAASPTLGCSIEISHDICICVCRMSN